MTRPSWPTAGSTDYVTETQDVITDLQASADDHETRLDTAEPKITAAESKLAQWDTGEMIVGDGVLTVDGSDAYKYFMVSIGSQLFFVDSTGITISGWKPGMQAISGSALSPSAAQILGGFQLTRTAGTAITLPAASAVKGGDYRFYFDAGNSAPITIARAGSDVFFGAVEAVDVANSNAMVADVSPGTATLLTFNGSAKGGRPGSLITVRSIGTKWHVSGVNICSGTPTTIFS